jgi:membrane protein DedA with SNARE-associated domain/membrane-associated phospholipid phosphatase
MSTARALLANHWVRLVLLAALAVGGYFLVKALLPEISLQDILDDVATTLGKWTYVIVGALAFLETGAFVGLIAPGETFVILAGAVAGVGETSLALTIWIVWASAFAGDSASFLLGHRLGRDFILRHGPKVRITEERFRRVEGYFERHGGKTILVGRFIGLVRALAPFIAGSSGMRYRNFAPFSVLGTGLWTLAFTLLGYFAARSLDKAAEVAGTGTLLFGITVGVIVAIVLVTRYLREPENRKRVVAEMEKRPGSRQLLALGRAIRPQARFVWNRITPGGLGLEVTTLLAVLAVGLFAVIAYVTTFDGNPGPTAADRTAMNIVSDIQSDWQTELNKVITRLGAIYVAFPIAAIGAVFLAWRRRWGEVAVVVVASVLTVIAVAELKQLIDRPRPPDPLIEPPGNDSFPSAHAAYSVVYVWLALMLARQLRPRQVLSRLTIQGLLILIGLALAAAIGLSRVYLRVHYLSDVGGGWALGAAIFALCGLVAIVVAHLRQNARGDAGRLAVEDRA